MGGAPRDFPLLGCVTIRAPSVRAHDEDACALPTNSFVGMKIEAPARLAPYQFNNQVPSGGSMFITRKPFRGSLAISAILLLSSMALTAPSAAQENRATIVGTVTDPQGNA